MKCETHWMVPRENAPPIFFAAERGPSGDATVPAARVAALLGHAGAVMVPLASDRGGVSRDRHGFAWGFTATESPELVRVPALDSIEVRL